MSQSILWNVFRKDIGRKLTALGLALGVWIWLASNLADERLFVLEVRVVETRREAEDAQVGVPALYVVKPKEFILLEGESVEATVLVRGLKTDLAMLELSAVFEVPLDALDDRGSANDMFDGTDTNEGEGTWRLQLNNPARFRAVGAALDDLDLTVKPGFINLVLARKARAVIDLGPDNVQLTGVPKSGYRIDSHRSVVVPNQIALIGPQKDIAEILGDPSLLKFEAIDLEGKSFTIHQYVRLDRDKVDRPVRLDKTDVVLISVPLYEEESSRELYTVPVLYENAEDLVNRGMEVDKTDQELDLQVIGPTVVLSQYSDVQLRKKIRLVFDWADAQHRVANIGVAVLDELPELIRIEDIDGGAPQIKYTLKDITPSGASGGTKDSP